MKMSKIRTKPPLRFRNFVGIFLKQIDIRLLKL